MYYLWQVLEENTVEWVYISYSLLISDVKGLRSFS